MVLRGFHPTLFDSRPARAPSRGVVIAIGLSVAVHIAAGLWIVAQRFVARDDRVRGLGRGADGGPRWLSSACSRSTRSR